MKNLYKCHHCDEVSNEDQWNSSTEKELTGIEIVPLNDSTDLYSTSYSCPKCSEKNDAWLLKKIKADN